MSWEAEGGRRARGIARGGRKGQSIFLLFFFVVCLFCLCCLFFVLCCVFCVLRPLSLLKISCGGGRGGGEHWGRWSKGGEVVNPSFCWCFLSFCLFLFFVCSVFFGLFCLFAFCLFLVFLLCCLCVSCTFVVGN